jgi:hypothetical protein
MAPRLLCFIALLTLAGLVTVHQRMQLVRLGYQCAELQQTRQDLLRERDVLQAELESLGTPAQSRERLEKAQQSQDEAQGW